MPQRRLVVLWILCILGALSAGTSAEPLPRETVDLLINRSGVEHLLTALPTTIGDGLSAALPEHPEVSRLLPDATTALGDAARRAFAPEQLLPVVRGTLADGMDGDQAALVLSWLESPLGVRLTQLEQAASSVETPELITMFLAGLAPALAADDRIELLHRLDGAAYVTEYGITTLVHIQLAVAIAVVETMPEQRRPSVPQLLQKLEAERPALEQEVRRVSLSYLLYVYRDVSDTDLHHYVVFLESPAGRTFQAAMAEGLDRAMTQAARVLGHDFGALVQAATLNRGA